MIIQKSKTKIIHQSISKIQILPYNRIIYKINGVSIVIN